VNAAGSSLRRASCRPWSLWDMMELKASAFYQAVSGIRHMQGFLFGKKDDPQTDLAAKIKSSGPAAAQIGRILDELNRSLDVLGAKLTKILLARVITQLALETLTWSQLSDLMDELDSRLKDELLFPKLLVIEENKLEYFESSFPIFGAEFETGFPTAAFELDEAAKCFALGRPTAAVFHLMRIMETGIRAIADCLGTPPPTKDAERNWGVMLRRIKEELDRRTAARPPLWGVSSDKDFFYEAYASLDAVRVAWRNTTMHVEKTYPEDAAEHIFGAVKGFMSALASRCDETGKPKA
jgi:hypothetical protein